MARVGTRRALHLGGHAQAQGEEEPEGGEVNARQAQLTALHEAACKIQAEHDLALRQARAERKPFGVEPSANVLWDRGGYGARHKAVTDACAAIVEGGPDGNAAIFEAALAAARGQR